VNPSARREQLRHRLIAIWPTALTLAEIARFPIYDLPPKSVVLADLLQLLAAGGVRLVPCSLPVRWEAS
jgi:hypothetical protein